MKSWLSRISRSRLAHGCISYAAVNAMCGLLPLFVLAFLMSQLPAADLGRYALFVAVVALMAPLMGCGAHAALARTALDDDQHAVSQSVDASLRVILVTTIVCALLVVPAHSVTSQFVPLTPAWTILMLAAAAAQSSVVLLLTFQQMKMRPLSYGIHRVGQGVLQALLTIVGTLAFGGWEGAAGGYAVGGIISSIAAIATFRHQGLWTVPLQHKALYDVLRIGLPMTPHILGAYLLVTADRVLLARLEGLEAAGTYAVACQFAMLVNLVGSSCSQALSPWIYRQLKDNTSVARTKVAQMTALYAMFLVCMATGIAVASSYVLSWYREGEYAGASHLVCWLVAAFVFHALYRIASNYFEFARATHLIAGITLVTTAVNLTLNYSLISWYGATGAAQATVVSYAVMCSLVWGVGLYLYSIPMNPFAHRTDFGFLELKDGSRQSLAQLLNQVPSNLFETELHVRTCEAIAAHRLRGRFVRRTYINILYLRSVRARQLTALIHLVKTGTVSATRLLINSSDAGLATLFPGTLQVVPIPGSPQPYIDFPQVRSLLLKSIAHRLFRLFSRSSPRTPVSRAIRAWVDVSEVLYAKEWASATVLIYPFPLNPLRQVRFLWSCIRKPVNFRLSGLPFRFRDVLACCISPPTRDRRVLIAEMRAFRTHAVELASSGFAEIMTTDEFEPASWAMYDRLQKLGIRSVNSAHGIGMYSPHIGYNEFRVINDVQRLFYQVRNPATLYVLQKMNHSAHTLTLPAPGHRPSLVYIHGYTHSRGYEPELQDRVLEFLRQLQQSGWQVFIKLHPNTSGRGKTALAKKFKLPLVTRLSELDGHCVIFVNLLSTCYYDFSARGVFVFVNDALFDASTHFGNGLPSRTLDAIAPLLESLCDASAYSEFHGRQIQRIRKTA